MKKRTSLVGIGLTLALFGVGCVVEHDEYIPATEESAQAVNTDLLVYGDALAAGWNSWASWTPHSLTANSPAHGGSNSISVTFSANWNGLELRPSSSAPVDTSGYDLVRFWIHGGTSGAQKVRFFLRDGNGNTDGPKVSVALQANQWNQVDIPLSSLGSPALIKGLLWQEAGGDTSSLSQSLYLDDISLALGTPPPPLTLSVNVATGRHSISPDIYGINGLEITPTMASTLRLPVRRWGGNAATRYNYLTDAASRASDWYFKNAGEYKPDPSSSVSAANQFVAQDVSTSTRSLMTVPMVGYVAKDKTSCSYTSTEHPDQTDFYGSCGNGYVPDPGDPTQSIPISGGNPLDTSIAANHTFVQGWVSHLVSQFGTAANGGVAYYNLDNEPALWSDTHRDVHPDPASYDEVRDRTYAYAAAIKAADPSAKTLGPVAWGWEEYLYSAKDRVVTQDCLDNNKSFWRDCRQDRMAHGDEPFVPWYLGQMKAYEQANSVRILDYLDLHYYPYGGIALKPAGDAQKQQDRLASTRSLWDPTYIAPGWYDEPVRLIPRMRGWVDQKYPLTKIAITEYNFGALDHINGALAQADALGIFGRERVDLATLWTYDPTHMPTFELTHPGAFAFRMYRNYDGAGSGFGNMAVESASSDPSRLSVYAAESTVDGFLTIMVVNKSGVAETSALGLAGFNPGTAAEVYRYSDANLGAIVHEANQAVTASGFTATYPPNSITLFVVPDA